MSRAHQHSQLSLQEAVAEAPTSAQMLLQLAAGHRQQRVGKLDCHSKRHWEPTAGTWCYQTHIAASAQTKTRLARLAEIVYRAAELPVQPWYPQFQGGTSKPSRQPTQGSIERHHMTLGRFDLGLQAPRYYRQLVSLARPDDCTAVVVARSIDQGPTLPHGAKLAYTLAPNGEVLHWENGRLHWHHICCTPGAGLLPTTLDRWLINALRATGLDQAERSTYRREALLWRDWLTGNELRPSPEALLPTKSAEQDSGRTQASYHQGH